MNFRRLAIPDVVLIEPKVFKDDRGFFMETYHHPRFAENGITPVFVQDNHSRSNRGVLRGLHFQKPPMAQGKLVRVGHGAIFDVAVDIRPGSKTYGRWVGEVLDDQNHCLLYIPAGFAHGFLTLQDQTDVLYKATQVYSPQHDAGLRWDDPSIAISWPDLGQAYIISEKDQHNPQLSEIA